MPLKRLKPNDLVLDRPLTCDLVDAGGNVVFHRGQSLERNSTLKRWLEQGLYRPDEEDDAEAMPVGLAKMLMSPGDLLQLQAAGTAPGDRYPVRLIGYHAPISLLVTAPVVNGRLAFIKEGQRFLVRGFVGRDAVGYSTRVLKTNLSPYAYLHLAWPEDVQTMRIRSSARVPVDLVCAVVAEGKQYAARMIDLSPGGARVRSATPIGEPGEQVKVAFRINPGGAEMYLSPLALIRGVSEDDGQFITGLEFIDVTESENLYLSNMVYQHLLKEKL